MSTPVNLLDIDLPLRKAERLHIGFMHYHLEPGGVTTVMSNIALALGLGGQFKEVFLDLFADIGPKGSRSRSSEFETGTGTFCSALHVNGHAIPGLGYRHESYTSRKDFERAAQALRDAILEKIDWNEVTPDSPYILHAHNISLGKNPVTTLAFKRMAEWAIDRKAPLLLLNQVHDFAENNRPELFQSLRHCTGAADRDFALDIMYANLPNVIYLAINSSDVENLLNLGLDNRRVFLLPNAMNTELLGSRPLWEMSASELQEVGLPEADYRDQLMARIEAYAQRHGYVFHKKRNVLLSPLKVMRRKNNIESVLLLAALNYIEADPGYQLLISLDANSPPDLRYSDKLKTFVKQRALPVTVGFGTDVLSPTGLKTAADGTVEQFSMVDLHSIAAAIVTTSIAEGFGLTFHEGWLSDVLVLGRKIPKVVGDFEASGMDFSHLYERLAVNLDWIDNPYTRLHAAFEQKMNTMRKAHGLSVLTCGEVESEVVQKKLFQVGDETCIDYADLSANMQLEVLGKLLDDSVALGRFISLNPTVEEISDLLKKQPSALINRNKAIVQERYSMAAMARRLHNLFSLGADLYRHPMDEEQAHKKIDNGGLISKYLEPKNVRLLL